MHGYYYYRLMEKICEHFNAFRILKTTVGYKLINVELFRTNNESVLSSETIEYDEYVEIDPTNILLSIDYLKDTYTLLGCRVQDSPHYKLMETLDKKEDIQKTEYMLRFRNGTLDARYPHHVKDFSFFYDKYNTMKKKLEENAVDPIVVFKVGDDYYIKDGKHRAALCAYFKKPIMCKVFDNQKMLGTIGKVVVRMVKSDPSYSKHNKLYNKLQTLKND